MYRVTDRRWTDRRLTPTEVLERMVLTAGLDAGVHKNRPPGFYVKILSPEERESLSGLTSDDVCDIRPFFVRVAKCR